jgi:hypothetical protein
MDPRDPITDHVREDINSSVPTVKSMQYPYNPADPARQNDLRVSDFGGSTGRRITRRRSSAGPVPPQRPQRPMATPNSGPRATGGPRPTFLTLRDHGKVYVADLPRLSDGQLAQVANEAGDVLSSLQRRLDELGSLSNQDPAERDTRIRAITKRDVTERFLRAIDEEQTLRRSNPALRAAAGESLAKAFLELARHRLPGLTFDALLQEALEACEPEAAAQAEAASRRVVPIVRRSEGPEPERRPLPVVLTPVPPAQAV